MKQENYLPQFKISDFLPGFRDARRETRNFFMIHICIIQKCMIHLCQIQKIEPKKDTFKIRRIPSSAFVKPFFTFVV
jgi:hypothetical protein